MISVSDLQSTFSSLITEVIGDVSIKFNQVSSFSAATDDSLIFIHNDKFLSSIPNSPAKVIVVAEKIKQKLSIDAKKTYIIAKKSDLLVAQILNKYFSIPANSSLATGRHPTVITGKNSNIDQSARIGPNVVIGNHVHIAKNVSIGANTYIDDHVVIEEGVNIGASNFIGKNSILKKDVQILSQNTIGTEPFCLKTKTVIKNASGSVVLEEGVELGAGNVIERGYTNATTIATGTKLDNRIFIGSESFIGPHSFLTAGLRISHNVVTGHHFVCGGGTHIEPNVRICDMVQVAGISCVTKDIVTSGAYGGFPLQPMKDYLRTTMTLTKISELRKDLAKLMNANEI